MSRPKTSAAPRRRAARARMPVPVPASSRRQPAGNFLRRFLEQAERHRRGRSVPRAERARGRNDRAGASPSSANRRTARSRSPRPSADPDRRMREGMRVTSCAAAFAIGPRKSRSNRAALARLAQTTCTRLVVVPGRVMTARFAGGDFFELRLIGRQPLGGRLFLPEDHRQASEQCLHGTTRRGCKLSGERRRLA